MTILSRQGHLCNDDAAAFASSIAAAGRLRHLVLAHLSRDCNRPDLALHTVASRLRADGFPAVTIATACVLGISALAVVVVSMTT